MDIVDTSLGLSYSFMRPLNVSRFNLMLAGVDDSSVPNWKIELLDIPKQTRGLEALRGHSAKYCDSDGPKIRPGQA